jgi:hypothetical protein
MTAPLPLGKVVATPGALQLLTEASAHPFDYLARHATGDWGDLCAFDRRQNQIALRDGYRAYPRDGNLRARARADPGNGLAARILTVDSSPSRRKYKPVGGLLHLLGYPDHARLKSPG